MGAEGDHQEAPRSRVQHPAATGDDWLGRRVIARVFAREDPREADVEQHLQGPRRQHAEHQRREPKGGEGEGGLVVLRRDGRRHRCQRARDREVRKVHAQHCGG